MPNDDLISSALRTQWRRIPSDVTALPAGLMSRAWTVTAGGERFVARLADPAACQSLEAGAAAAEYLGDRGVDIGRPVRTLTGGLTAETPAGTLSLQHQVPGRALDGRDPLDQQWWGDRLGAAHRELTGFDPCGLRQWNWLQPDAPHLAVESWLRPAVSDAVGAMTRLTVTDRLTYGVLHGDPAPSDFFLDSATGRVGLLGWGSCGTGPLVYDVASAVVYAGGLDESAELIDGYVAAGPVAREEVEAALPVLVRFRWAVQADWSARRLWADVGAADRSPSHRQDGLPAQRVVDGSARRSGAGSPERSGAGSPERAADESGWAVLRRAREALEATATGGTA